MNAILVLIITTIIINIYKRTGNNHGNRIRHSGNLDRNCCGKMCKNELLSYFPTNVECYVCCHIDFRAVCKCHEIYKENIAFCLCL